MQLTQEQIIADAAARRQATEQGRQFIDALMDTSRNGGEPMRRFAKAAGLELNRQHRTHQSILLTAILQVLVNYHKDAGTDPRNEEAVRFIGKIVFLLTEEDYILDGRVRLPYC